MLPTVSISWMSLKKSSSRLSYGSSSTRGKVQRELSHAQIHSVKASKLLLPDEDYLMQVAKGQLIQRAADLRRGVDRFLCVLETAKEFSLTISTISIRFGTRESIGRATAMATLRGYQEGQDPEPLTKQEIVELRAKLSPELQEEEWYTILTAATASAHAGAEAVPLIYEIASEAVNALEGKKADEMAIRIQRRIKESLLKGSVLFGIAGALDSAFALLQITRSEVLQRPSRCDSGFFQRRCETLEGVASRGMKQLERVYLHNMDNLLNEKMGEDMDDLRFLTVDINYGWNLSELGVLDFKSTEMVILAALIPQNARAATMWHLRGCRRAGWSDECIRNVRIVCVQLAERLGCRTSKLPDLEDVKEHSND